nr:hypothetical protein [Tanacetum cinerariifolium]
MVVSKSSAVSAADAPNEHQQPTTPLNNHTTPAPTCQTSPITPTVTSSYENINQAEPHAKNDEVADDKFINIFLTPVQDQGETSSRHVDSSNMHTFYERYPSERLWTKDHPLEQTMASVHNSTDPAPTCQTMASVHNSSDPAPTCQTMASAYNSSDPAPTCQTMALVQISSDPAPECQTMALEYDSLSPRRKCQENVSHRDKTDDGT